MTQTSPKRDPLVVVPRRRQNTPPRTKYVVLYRLGSQNIPVAYSDVKTSEMMKEVKDEINRFIEYVQMVYRLLSTVSPGGGRIHVQMSSLLPVPNTKQRVYVPDDVSVIVQANGYEITVAPLREVQAGLRLVSIARNGRRIDEFLVSAWNTYEALKRLLTLSQVFAPRHYQPKVKR